MAFYYMIPALANMYAAVFLPCREIDKSLGETISYMSVDLNVECGSDVHTATQMTALSGFVIVIPMCVGLSYYPWISSVSKIIEERPGRSGVKPMIDFAITQLECHALAGGGRSENAPDMIPWLFIHGLQALVEAVPAAQVNAHGAPVMGRLWHFKAKNVKNALGESQL